MRPRKKIISPRLRDYFHLERSRTSLNHQLYFNTQIFNGFAFLTTFSIICLGLGFLKPHFWPIGFSIIFLLIFLYKKSHRLCEGITIIRDVPRYSVEKKEIEVAYKISNETGFPLNDLQFQENFDGVQEGSYYVHVPEGVPSHTQIKVTRKLILNAGMGVKTFKPIRINVRDELGVFDFKLEIIQASSIEVYPYIEDIPSFKNSISPESIDFGLYEISKRGDSNLFMGTREYRRGDPVKLINWKLTKKSDRVIVNEFEKTTNTFITLLLDLDLKSQSGQGEISTWELTKDLALSICQNEIQKNNSIQIISNDLYLPWGTGRNQISLFEKYFTHHELKSIETNDYTRHLSLLPARSQIYYICPVYLSPETHQILEHLKMLKAEGHRVNIFTINPLRELARGSTGSAKANLLELNLHLEANLQRVKSELMNFGIPLLAITQVRDISLREHLIKAQADDLLETK